MKMKIFKKRIATQAIEGATAFRWGSTPFQDCDQTRLIQFKSEFKEFEKGYCLFVNQYPLTLLGNLVLLAGYVDQSVNFFSNEIDFFEKRGKALVLGEKTALEAITHDFKQKCGYVSLHFLSISRQTEGPQGLPLAKDQLALWKEATQHISVLPPSFDGLKLVFERMEKQIAETEEKQVQLRRQLEAGNKLKLEWTTLSSSVEATLGGVASTQGLGTGHLIPMLEIFQQLQAIKAGLSALGTDVKTVLKVDDTLGVLDSKMKKVEKFFVDYLASFKNQLTEFFEEAGSRVQLKETLFSVPASEDQKARGIQFLESWSRLTNHQTDLRYFSNCVTGRFKQTLLELVYFASAKPTELQEKIDLVRQIKQPQFEPLQEPEPLQQVFPTYNHVKASAGRWDKLMDLFRMCWPFGRRSAEA